ncbi:HlyD family secretion protein [Roseospira marina]|uniref:HlyD family secretion protein n=1 Tax=Roseospira marina TaxID=140057 RepID=A0A5M6IDX4_9PROT|nr:HlyD family secretion protein [Roseospira marina]KAA5605959.1 HlyD family secretion protein [Roseospira marina]MBB4313195.1 membrane fusion protein (multidrug efflux system) [Roseospira marina]MBB5086064.1 membrane fusion protein (multidrug efflux system) [Roseospira marina]
MSTHDSEQAPPQDGTAPTNTPQNTGDRRGPSPRKIVLSVVGVGLLIGALWLGWQWWTVFRFIETTEDAYIQADIVAVSPLVAGEVTRVAVEDHQTVAAGDLLFTIDASDYEASRDAAQAAVASADASLAENAEQRTLQERTIAVAEADVAAAKASLDFARQEYDRDSELARKGSGTVRAAQRSREALVNAESAVTSREATLARARQQLDVIDAQRTRLVSERQRAAAQLRTAEINLNRTTVLSPAAGTIGNRQIEAGEYVRPGVQAISVVPDDPYVVANFKETQLEYFKPGMDADIEIDMLSGTALHATIESLAPAAGQEFAILPPQNATGNFTKIVQRVPVKIRFAPDQPEVDRLKPGTSAIVSIDTKGQQE